MKFLGPLVAALLAFTTRLARLTALRELLEESTAALDEAARLEAKGHPQLANYVRSQIDETLGGSVAAGGAPAVNGNGQPPPFELPRPTPAGLNPPAGQGMAPRRRGRRPSGADGVQQLELPRENPADPADPMSSPTTSPDQQP